jgi:hypothetical protein
MKRILLYFILPMIVFSACSKDEDYKFDQSPEDRINSKLAEYQAALLSSPIGWNATIATGSGGIFHFFFQFNDSNRVFMYSDFDLAAATTRGESSYRLKALQQPTLIFDTYSYLHMLADPDASVNGGNYGEGLISDFEYIIDMANADSIKLTGRYNGTKLTLLKASQQDLDNWQNGLWANTLLFENIGKIQNYFKRLRVNGVDYEMQFDQVARIITLSWLVGGNLQQFTTGYYYTMEGLVFTTPFNTGSQVINGFTDPSWDPGNMVLHLEVNGTPGTIAGAIKPLKVDLNAPTRWWQTAASEDSYWISFSGFHVNGVDDAYAVSQTTNFLFLVYWPIFGTSSGITYDLLGNVVLDGSASLNYGAAYQNPPQFTADGRVVFTQIGTLGPTPPAAFISTGAQLEIPAGYYLIQTGPSSYDMVSASDAKAWITWER